jgi:5'-nucleotidase/UDP-sugar diphosphatase
MPHHGMTSIPDILPGRTSGGPRAHTRSPRGRRSRSGPLLALAVLVALLAAAAPPAQAAPNGVDFTLTVLHNNDGESDLLASPDDDDPGAGTISRFGWLLNDLRSDALRGPSKARGKTGVIAITAGDNFLASPEWQASLDKGIPFYDAIALDHIGYDAFTIGNHEFDFGPEVLADFINSFEGGDVFLSANLDFSGEPSLQALVDQGRIRPSIVVKERGERIGIVGATTPELDEVTSPGDVVVDDDVASAVQDEVDRLTAMGIDKILLSSHLQDIDNEIALVTQLSDVDAVIGGGGGEDIASNYPLTAVDADGTTVPVVTVPGDYFDVGRLVLEFDRNGNVLGWDGALEPVTSDLPQDPFLVEQVEEPVSAYLSDLADTVIATSEVGLNGIRGDVRTRETNLGNLMTDGMIATGTALAAEYGVPEPQVALQNGGGIRNDSIIGPGDISLLDTFDIAPFTNFVAVMPDVASGDFVAAVEHGLSGLPDAAGSFGQWGGLTVTYDPAAPAGSRIVDLVLDDGTVVVAGGAVVSTEPVTLATIDFLAGGNDGYDMFETYDFTRVGVSYQQSLADWIDRLGTITTAEYADPVAPSDRDRIAPVP